MMFKIDKTGKSDNVRAYIEYRLLCSCSKRNLDEEASRLYSYIISWATKEADSVPEYFCVAYLRLMLTGKGKEIPDFLLRWISRYYSTSIERMTGFTPFNEIVCILKERKIAATQAKLTDSQLLEIWRLIPDFEKAKALENVQCVLNYFFIKPDEVKILRKIVVEKQSEQSSVVIKLPRLACGGVN